MNVAFHADELETVWEWMKVSTAKALRFSSFVPVCVNINSILMSSLSTDATEYHSTTIVLLRIKIWIYLYDAKIDFGSWTAMIMHHKILCLQKRIKIVFLNIFHLSYPFSI